MEKVGTDSEEPWTKSNILRMNGHVGTGEEIPRFKKVRASAGDGSRKAGQ